MGLFAIWSRCVEHKCRHRHTAFFLRKGSASRSNRNGGACCTFFRLRGDAILNRAYGDAGTTIVRRSCYFHSFVSLGCPFFSCDAVRRFRRRRCGLCTLITRDIRAHRRCSVNWNRR